ncbi:TetR/AcrR family transcriptional regulator [Nocardiopsis flavescens]|uniref:TetR/AcrR family transcriptional regulator n=1 Tax=Nocardiopsis flavescens TaxID=758803 RepID=UPI00366800E8
MRRAVVEDSQLRPEDGVPGALRQDARRNRLSVLRAAREVFRDRGLEATVRNVARRAGVSAATVHRRFPGRDALVEDLAGHAAGELTEHFAELSRTLPADLALERGLRRVAAEAVSSRVCGPDHRERFPERARALDAHLHRELHRLLVRAREGGHVAAEITEQDLRLATSAVTAAVAAEPDPERAGRTAQRLVTHFLRSFRGTG